MLISSNFRQQTLKSCNIHIKFSGEVNGEVNKLIPLFDSQGLSHEKVKKTLEMLFEIGTKSGDDSRKTLENVEAIVKSNIPYISPLIRDDKITVESLTQLYNNAKGNK